MLSLDGRDPRLTPVGFPYPAMRELAPSSSFPFPSFTQARPFPPAPLLSFV